MKTCFYALTAGLLSVAGLPGVVGQANAQTTYYVAGNGSDNSDGRSAGSPFQSINKVNGLTL